ncbi:MAG: hypothetical protein VX346_03610 [Planctomycetota bacterium]|nr:hypothetical protein [Planctomycetota bacterium]
MLGFICELFVDLLFFDFFAKLFRDNPAGVDPDPLTDQRPEKPPNQEPPRIT